MDNFDDLPTATVEQRFMLMMQSRLDELTDRCNAIEQEAALTKRQLTDRCTALEAEVMRSKRLLNMMELNAFNVWFDHIAATDDNFIAEVKRIVQPYLNEGICKEVFIEIHESANREQTYAGVYVMYLRDHLDRVHDIADAFNKVDAQITEPGVLVTHKDMQRILTQDNQADRTVTLRAGSRQFDGELVARVLLP